MAKDTPTAQRVNPPVWLYRAKLSAVAVGTSPQQVLSDNPKRVAVLFTSGSVGSWYIWPEPLSADPKGIPLPNNLQSLEFKFNDHPGLVVGPWYAQESTVGGTLLIAEDIAN